MLPVPGSRYAAAVAEKLIRTTASSVFIYKLSLLEVRWD
jgi:hypothetical protein